MPTLKLPYSGMCELTSRYGMRDLNGSTERHDGIDLCGITDNRILAPCSGVVGVSTIITYRGNKTWEWGNYVRIDADNGLKIYLCHMESRAVEAGQRVNAGDVLGIEGNTGYSFGQHCHFEVRQNGVPIDPTPLLGIRNEWGYYSNDTQLEEPRKPDILPVGDNTPDEYARDAVEWATSREILKGTDTGDLKLHSNVTRQDLIVILYRLELAREEYYNES